MAQIIVALDGLTHERAIELAKAMAGEEALFKANDLLDYPGPAILDELAQFGLVMADAKLHDIPKTVERRTIKLMKMKPAILTVHASGGVEMIMAAVKAAAEYYPDCMIFAVTVLTSLNEEICQLNLGAPVKAKVLQYARDALLAGAHGIVCSAKELEFLAGYPELGQLKKACAGIRPAWYLDPTDDQARIMTPGKAVKKGADYLVIGRPITLAEDPSQAFSYAVAEIAAALAEIKKV